MQDKFVKNSNVQQFIESSNSFNSKEKYESTLSQFTDAYKQICQLPVKDLPVDIEEMTNRMKAVNIIYSPDLAVAKTKDSTFQIRIHDFFDNYQVVDLRVHWNSFIFIIRVINIDEESPCHQIFQNYSGSFGAVYKAPLEHQTAIKCHVIPEGKYGETLRSVIKQYCIQAIASVLEIGPYNSKMFFADLIVYESCVQFTMEFCDRTYNIGNTIEQDLFQEMTCLHSFNIVHCDIKPQNICYSPKYNKYVLIDFGLSEILQEKQGYKTQTNFRGSLAYCGNEMRNCYLSPHKKLIDLYYNDAFSLSQSLKYIAALPKMMQLDKIMKEGMSQQFMMFPQKYLLFKREMQRLQALRKQFFIIVSQKKTNQIRNYFKISSLKTCLCTKSIQHQKNHFEYLSKDQTIQRPKTFSFIKPVGNISTFLSKRINLLELTNTLELNDILDEQMLLQPETIKTLSTQTFQNAYYKTLAHFLQINTLFFDNQQKLQAAKTLRKVINIETPLTMSSREIFESAINYLFDYSISLPISQNKSYIFQQIILSVIILQSKSEESLVQAFYYFMDAQTLSIVSKLHIMITLFLALNWLRYISECNYHLFQLYETILIKTRQTLLKLTSQEQLINEITKILSDIINIQFQNTQIHFVFIINKLVHLHQHSTIKIQKLIEDIHKYVLYLCWHKSAKINNILFRYVNIHLELLVQRQMRKYGAIKELQYCYFILQECYQFNKQFFKNLKQLIHQIFQFWNIHFIIFLLQDLTASQKNRQQQLEAILKTLTIYLNRDPNNPQPLVKINIFLQIISTESKQYLFNNFGTAISQQFLLFLKKFKHPQHYLLSYHQFVSHISLIIIVLFNYFWYGQGQIQFQENLKQQLQDIFEQVKCFECKFKMICEIGHLQAAFARYHKQQELSFEITFRLVIRYLQNNQIQKMLNHLYFITYLENSNEKLRSRISVIGLLFQIIKLTGGYQYYFIGDKDTLFIKTYIYLLKRGQLQYLSELIQGIICQLRRQTSGKKGEDILKLFMLIFLQIPTKQIPIQQHTQKHLMLTSYFNFSNPFIAIYMISLLSFLPIASYLRPIFVKISLCLNRLDLYHKQLIFKYSYFKLALHYFKPKTRQQIFYHKNNFKYEVKIQYSLISLTKMTYNLIQRKKCRNDQKQFYRRLQLKTKKYHLNIGNYKHT